MSASPYRVPSPRPDADERRPAKLNRIDWSRVAETALWLAFWVLRIALGIF
jgi:hypothetical protein